MWPPLGEDFFAWGTPPLQNWGSSSVYTEICAHGKKFSSVLEKAISHISFLDACLRCLCLPKGFLLNYPHHYALRFVACFLHSFWMGKSYKTYSAIKACMACPSFQFLSYFHPTLSPKKPGWHIWFTIPLSYPCNKSMWKVRLSRVTGPKVTHWVSWQSRNLNLSPYHARCQLSFIPFFLSMLLMYMGENW